MSNTGIICLTIIALALIAGAIALVMTGHGEVVGWVLVVILFIFILAMM